MYKLSCNVTNPVIDRLRPSASHLQQTGKKRSGLYNISAFSNKLLNDKSPGLNYALPVYLNRLGDANVRHQAIWVDIIAIVIMLIQYIKLHFPICITQKVHTYAQQKNLIVNYLYYKETQLLQMIYYNKCNLLIINKICYMYFLFE